nr:TPA_asm: hypothetical protein [Tricladiphe virus]
MEDYFYLLKAEPAIELMEEVLRYPDELAQLERDLAYVGFDVGRIRKRLQDISIQNGRTEQQFIKDVKILVALYLTRGTAALKMQHRSGSEKWKMVAQPVLTMYNLKERVGTNSDTITLSRVANAFPECAASLLCNHRNKFAHLNPDLPPFLCFPGAASLIPSDNDELIQEHKRFTRALHKTINRGTKTAEHQLDSRWNASHNCNFYSDERRQEILDILYKKYKDNKVDNIPSTSEAGLEETIEDPKVIEKVLTKKRKSDGSPRKRSDGSSGSRTHSSSPPRKRGPYTGQL